MYCRTAKVNSNNHVGKNLTRLRRELYRRCPGGTCPTSRRDAGGTGNRMG
ncbi:MAG: hypothetical protein JXD22_14445 [Sedimentisphaerales bacterium]|nr:hypothetical protein [Sedimentisphaerales bacterium]